MYIVIVGCGRLGTTLAEDLADSGYDVSIIDRDANRLDALGNGFNGLRIKGIEYDNDILRQAGIEKANYVISVTSEDNINITVSLIAKKIYKVPKIIARVNEPKKKAVYEKLEIETMNLTELGAYLLKSRIEEALQ